MHQKKTRRISALSLSLTAGTCLALPCFILPKNLLKLDSGAGDFFKANWGILLLAVLLVAALIAITILALRMKKKNEEFKAAKAKEEHEKAAQAAFIANASHDLRTPLNGVTGYTALALKATTLQKKQEYLESIASCNALLTGLVIDILDLSRLDSGKMSLIPETMDPLKAYQDVIMMVAPLADQKNITLLSDESLCPPRGRRLRPPQVPARHSEPGHQCHQIHASRRAREPANRKIGSPSRG